VWHESPCFAASAGPFPAAATIHTEFPTAASRLSGPTRCPLPQVKAALEQQIQEDAAALGRGGVEAP
jgi:hypothetical protein